MINSLHSRGIILTPLLIFIALVSMIAGTVAVLNRGVFAWDSGESRGQLNAATLKKQAADLKAGFSQAVASGIDGGLITLDEGSKGLYNPSSGFAIKPTIPPSACTAASCEWQINTTLKISDIVGSSSSSSSSSGSSSGSSTPTTEGCVENNGVFTYFVLAQTKEPKDIVFLAPGLNASACEQLIKSETTVATDGKGTAVPATSVAFVPGAGSGGGGRDLGTTTEDLATAQIPFNPKDPAKVPAVYFTPDGSPYLKTNNTITIPGTSLTASVEVNQPLTKAAVASSLVNLLTATTPPGSALTAGSLASALNNVGISDIKPQSDGTFAVRQASPDGPSVYNSRLRPCVTCKEVFDDLAWSWSGPYYYGGPVFYHFVGETCTFSYISSGAWGENAGQVYYYPDGQTQPPQSNCTADTATAPAILASNELTNKLSSSPDWTANPTSSSPLGRALQEAVANPQVPILPGQSPQLSGPSRINGPTTTGSAIVNGSSVLTTKNTYYSITYSGNSYSIQKITSTTY